MAFFLPNKTDLLYNVVHVLGPCGQASIMLHVYLPYLYIHMYLAE